MEILPTPTSLAYPSLASHLPTHPSTPLTPTTPLANARPFHPSLSYTMQRRPSASVVKRDDDHGTPLLKRAHPAVRFVRSGIGP
ncbi:uncharacterized protein BDZ99DRAFT_464191 [Mytilinidion resinicola]|uniref:Uncharacterized protein n=1 Tax=Mytilinidion resinicola TaxID=574789 RepID=A0A6A6YK25_9PEZI|nr:uncharacterized protein BDZ99DRAFT_464191 [Mytilinidion resinicola]KAF2808315.1 hypothetical protein BDZ99DRAFT_464191 [Mytilinidion resinicola]